MWEINYPFPYLSPEVSTAFFEFLQTTLHSNPEEGMQAYRHIRSLLSLEDGEYLLLQEWKEGFARYIKNRICQ